MSQEDLWTKIGTQCLNIAAAELEKMENPTDKSIDRVQRLIAIAISIDELNLRWEAQTRSGAAVFRGPVSVQTKAGN